MRQTMIQTYQDALHMIADNNYDDVEFYEYNNNNVHGVHTDSITSLDVDKLPAGMPCDIYEMDEDEYNKTILANSSTNANFDEYYGNKDAKVLVILIPHNALNDDAYALIPADAPTDITTLRVWAHNVQDDNCGVYTMYVGNGGSGVAFCDDVVGILADMPDDTQVKIIVKGLEPFDFVSVMPREDYNTTECFLGINGHIIQYWTL